VGTYLTEVQALLRFVVDKVAQHYHAQREELNRGLTFHVQFDSGDLLWHRTLNSPARSLKRGRPSYFDQSKNRLVSDVKLRSIKSRYCLSLKQPKLQAKLRIQGAEGQCLISDRSNLLKSWRLERDSQDDVPCARSERHW